MDSSFGARLRLQRERQQITLSTIAEQTKIKLSLLEGLERDDVSHWPAGIFRRSYVRAYARAIGLEPDTVLREFLSLHRDPSHEIPPAAAPIAGDESARRPPTRLRFLIGSALGALPTRRVQAEPRHAAGERAPVPLDVSAMAQLCTRLARAAESRDVELVLEDAARLLDAVGLVLWMWDPQGRALRAVFSHGYSDDVVAHLSGVPSEADNSIARAFRSAEPSVVDGSDLETGAVVVPLMAPTGCAGVLAFELRDGGERRESVRAVATILAAQLSTLVGYSPLAQAASD